MRITDSLTENTLENNVNTSLTKYNNVTQQISTGKQLTQLSDNPAEGSQDLALHASLVDNAQYQTNAADANSFLSSSDSALSSTNTLLDNALQIATQGANGTQNATDLSALGDEVGSIIAEVTQLANSDYHGKYLFGGTETTSEPFTAPTTGSDPTPTYTGNSGAVTATLGKNYSLPLNVPGDAAFGSTFTALQSLQTDLNAGDTTAVSADITKVNAAITSVTNTRAQIGAKSNEITNLTSTLQRAQGDYQDAISNIEDTDLATAYVQQQSAENVYQAALETTSQSFKLSLADYLN